MAMKLTFSVLFLIYFEALKWSNEFEISLPIRAEPACDDGFYHLNEKCYKFMENNGNFAEAQLDCESVGGKLVSIHDFQTNQYLYYIARADVLLGLQYDDAIANYTWADGSPYDYFNWLPGIDPIDLLYAGKCVMMKANDGTWINKKCDAKDIRHICQKPAAQEPTDVPPTDEPNQCPKVLAYMKPGNLSSPGYPSHYQGASGGLNCSYLLTAQGPITITFNELYNGAKEPSWISIYEGVHEQGRLIQSFTGDFYDLPRTYQVNGEFMFLRFNSSVEGKWRAVWSSSSSSTSQKPSSITSASGPQGLK